MEFISVKKCGVQEIEKRSKNTPIGTEFHIEIFFDAEINSVTPSNERTPLVTDAKCVAFNLH